MDNTSFDYQRPVTLEEAFGLLSVEGARPLASGHSLLPAMKLRVSNPTALVDISRIPGMEAIEQNGGGRSELRPPRLSPTPLLLANTA